MWRRSSPTEYWRWSANSTDEPPRLLFRSPLIRPTKIFLLTSSSCSSLWRNSGSRRAVEAVSGMGRHLSQLSVCGFPVADRRTRIVPQGSEFRDSAPEIVSARPVREVEQPEHQP